MRPVSSPDNVRDGLLGYSVLDAEHLEGDDMRHVLLTYLDNLRLGEYGGATAASFLVLVRHVVCMSSKKEVIGPHAWRIVAVMTNIHAFRYRAIMQFVAEPMRQSCFAIDTYIAVTVTRSAASPFPAAGRSILVDLFPKAVDGRSAAIVSMHKPLGLTFNPSELLVGVRGYLRRLSAAAFAEFDRSVLRGKIGHVATFLSRFGHAAGRFQRRCGASIGDLNYSTCELISLEGRA